MERFVSRSHRDLTSFVRSSPVALRLLFTRRVSGVFGSTKLSYSGYYYPANRAKSMLPRMASGALKGGFGALSRDQKWIKRFCLFGEEHVAHLTGRHFLDDAELILVDHEFVYGGADCPAPEDR